MPDYRTELRTRMVTDPISVIRELGVSDRDFDKLSRQLIIAWKHDEPVLAPYTPPAPSNENQRWWCTESRVYGENSFCERDRSGCEEFRRKVTPMGATHRACEHWKGPVACFTMKAKLANSLVLWCSMSFEECKSARAFMAAKKDDLEVRNQCEAVE